MKTYEEVAKSVFEKSEKYFEEKARKVKHIKTAATAMGCFCLAAGIVAAGVAALNNNLTEYPAFGGADGQFTADGENINISEETTVFTTTEALTSMPEAVLTDENGFPVEVSDEFWHGELSTISGVSVPFFVAFDGALYASYCPVDGGSYVGTGIYTHLGENYTCQVCKVQERPDHIGVIINQVAWEYKKLFDCDFDIGGQKFQIVYNALKDIDHACGDVVLQTDDFTVYEAVRLQGEPSDTKEYIVDLLPVLKREMPDLFGDDETDYGDAWWIAVSNITIPEDVPSGFEFDYYIPDDPSLPLGVFIGVDPSDIDFILAQAKAAEYYIKLENPKSVWVGAERGSDVYSLVDGEVVMAEDDGVFGYTVEVKMTDGNSVKHFHFNEMLVEVGDTVAKGQVIGHAGSTGLAIGNGVGYWFITDYTDTHHIHDETHTPHNSSNSVSPSSGIPVEPSLPLNTLTDVTSVNIDQILAAAQEVSSDIYSTVFVPAETGSEVYSLVNGTVVMAEYHGAFGYCIEVETADGQRVKHFHLSEMFVKVGDTVGMCQIIGFAGNTGYTSYSGVGYCVTDCTDDHHTHTPVTGTHDTDNHHTDNHH